MKPMMIWMMICVMAVAITLFVGVGAARAEQLHSNPTAEDPWCLSLSGDFGTFDGDTEMSPDDSGNNFRVGLAHSLSAKMDLFADYRRGTFSRERSGNTSFESDDDTLWLGVRFHTERRNPTWYELGLAGQYKVSSGDAGSGYKLETSRAAVEISGTLFHGFRSSLLPYIRLGGYALVGSENIEETYGGQTYDSSESGLGEADIEARLGLVRFGDNFNFFGGVEYFTLPWSDLSTTYLTGGAEIAGETWYLLIKGKIASQEQDQDDGYTIEQSGSGLMVFYAIRF